MVQKSHGKRRGIMNIALVNPPGTLRYIRDYYTSLIAKANYDYPPIDFVWLSASLEKPLRVFDAIVEEMSCDELVSALAEYRPSHIFYLVSGLSLKEDIQTIGKIKSRLDVRIIALGDICRTSPREVLARFPLIDAVLQSFACTDIMDIIRKDDWPKEPVPGWAFRSPSGAIVDVDGQVPRAVRIGVPKWDIFPLKSYAFPFALSLPVGTVLTDYGCPFKCSYCSIGTIGWRLRELDEVVAEIDLLQSLGIKEIHFRDQTFGADRDRTGILMRRLAERRLTWSCFTRMDIVTKESLSSMKEAGCHTIIFGIESGDHAVRQKYGKGLQDELIFRTLKMCQELGIKTVGTFIIGLPGEKEEDVVRTIRFAQQIPLDYASFNIAVPRLGSALRSSLDRTERAGTDVGYEVDGFDFMPREEAIRWASLAARKFYLRPAYIVNRLSKMGSVASLVNECRVGCKVLFGSYSRKKKRDR